MPDRPTHPADLYLALSPEQEDAPRSGRPRGVALALAVLFAGAMPLSVGVAAADGPGAPPPARLAAVDDDGTDDPGDDDDPRARAAQVADTVDGNTSANSRWSRTGNTRGADTTRVPDTMEGNSRGSRFSRTGNTGPGGDTTRGRDGDGTAGNDRTSGGDNGGSNSANSRTAASRNSGTGSN